jgi:hypothetical protein
LYTETGVVGGGVLSPRKDKTPRGGESRREKRDAGPETILDRQSFPKHKVENWEHFKVASSYGKPMVKTGTDKNK